MRGQEQTATKHILMTAALAAITQPLGRKENQRPV